MILTTDVIYWIGVAEIAFCLGLCVFAFLKTTR